METAFTPLSGLLGGALIGLSAVLLWHGLGRIAGISGIFGSALEGLVRAVSVSGLRSATEASGDRTGTGGAWRWAFLAGFVLMPLGALILTPGVAQITLSGGPILLAAAGLLVGLGTTLGNGCTSGHGVCGLGRLSPRSAVAVVVFLIVDVVTTALVRHAFDLGPVADLAVGQGG